MDKNGQKTACKFKSKICFQRILNGKRIQLVPPQREKLVHLWRIKNLTGQKLHKNHQQFEIKKKKRPLRKIYNRKRIILVPHRRPQCWSPPGDKNFDGWKTAKTVSKFKTKVSQLGRYKTERQSNWYPIGDHYVGHYRGINIL